MKWNWPRKWQCPCPYGTYLLVPLFFSAAAVMCTGYAAFECTFFRITGMSSRRVTINFGLWTVEQYRAFDSEQLGEPLENVYAYKQPNSCTRWSKHADVNTDDIDMPLRAARAAVLMAFMVSPFILVYLYRGRNELFSQTAVQAMSCAMLFTALFSGLSLLALQSSICQDDKENCEIGYAGYVSMMAVVFWVLACCTTCTLHGTRGIRRRRRKPGESRRERRAREREERRLAAEGRRTTNVEDFDDEGLEDVDIRGDIDPLADADLAYISGGEDEGVFRDDPKYTDTQERVLRDDSDTFSIPYRDNDEEENASYHSNSRPVVIDDDRTDKSWSID